MYNEQQLPCRTSTIYMFAFCKDIAPMKSDADARLRANEGFGGVRS